MTLQRIPDRNYEYTYGKPDISRLILNSCTYNVFKFLPRDFKLTTNNFSYFFNSNILSNSSITILHHIEKNPNHMAYHLDIENSDGVIKKLEQLYQGESIHLDEKELQIFKAIVEKLKLKTFFNKADTKIQLNSQQYPYECIITIDLWSLISFFHNDIPESFVIQTKKAEYKCSNYGILLSSVIRENLSKDPKNERYFYDNDDEENKFELISSILNFKDTDINKDNANTILEICEDLGIDCLIQILTDFINDNQKIDQSIDNQQIIIESINDLFDLLYHIKEKTVDFVAEKIIESKWSNTEENVYELAAFIIQVIRSKHELHEYFIELLLKLNENTITKLNILFPFIINYVINYTIHDDSIFFFVYLLRKRNIISFEKVIYLLSNLNSNDICFVTPLFSKEINEICSIRNIKINDLLHDIDVYKYEEICKNMKNDNIDEIAIAIENDDIDTFQKLISSNIDENLTKKVEQILITPSIMRKNTDDDSIFFDVTYLNYAAIKGSIKCFKYLLLNNQEIDLNTLSMAIIGGNVEIIRIAFNKNKENELRNVMNELRNVMNEWINVMNEWINVIYVLRNVINE